jgi:uncharacterized membrane protein
MLRKTMSIIVLATVVGLGTIPLSTAALARGGGHFGGGHFGGFGGAHMSHEFGGFRGEHEHGEFHRGFSGYGYLPYDCNYPHRSHYPYCY